MFLRCIFTYHLSNIDASPSIEHSTTSMATWLRGLDPIRSIAAATLACAMNKRQLYDPPGSCGAA